MDKEEKGYDRNFRFGLPVARKRSPPTPSCQPQVALAPNSGAPDSVAIFRRDPGGIDLLRRLGAQVPRRVPCQHRQLIPIARASRAMNAIGTYKSASRQE